MISLKRAILFVVLLLNISLSFSQAKKAPAKTDEPDLSIQIIKDSDVPPAKTGKKVTIESGDDNTIYNTAGIDVKPEFYHGIEEMYGFIRKNFVVPQEIIDEKTPKTIFVSFIVEKDGSLTDIKVLRDIGYGTGKEAIRVLKLMPKWLPGEQNGHHVRCQYSMPIRLNGGL